MSVSEVIPQKYIFYNHTKQLNITLEMSNRVSHQLATIMFQIILQEILGYADVDVQYFDNESYDIEHVVPRLRTPMNFKRYGM